jgi:hypothetical protein
MNAELNDIIARSVISRALIARIILATEGEEIADLWSEYPDIGEDDWAAITALTLGIGKSFKQSPGSFEIAYDRLKAKSLAWEEQQETEREARMEA